MAMSLSALRARLRFTLQEDSWYSFLLEAESTPGPILRMEALGELKKFSDPHGIP
jgi:hypothetical protein